MAEFDLNLSTQPFPAYRLTTTALLCLLVVLGVVSVWQASGFVRYSAMVRSIRSEEQESRVEAETLGKRVAELESRLDRPEATAKLSEINFLNHLILQKSLSVTKLFGILEEMVPANLHLTNLTPEITADGTITLRLGLRAKSMIDVKEFLQKMESSPLFEKINVKVEEKRDPTSGSDIDVTLSANYYPDGDKR